MNRWTRSLTLLVACSALGCDTDFATAISHDRATLNLKDVACTPDEAPCTFRWFYEYAQHPPHSPPASDGSATLFPSTEPDVTATPLRNASTLDPSTWQHISEPVTGLSPNTQYYFRVCGSKNSAPLLCGSVLSFRTKFDPSELPRRRDLALTRHITNPSPGYESISSMNPEGKGCVSDATRALALLWRGTTADVAQANQLLEGITYTRYPIVNWTKVRQDLSDNCYFGGYLMLAKILLHPATQAKVSALAVQRVKDRMRDYLVRFSRVSDTTLANEWTIQGSENHDAMRTGHYLLMCQVLRTDPARNGALSDGSNVQAHYDAWTTFWIARLKNHAKRGLSVEQNSGYNKYNTATYLLLRDLAGLPGAGSRGSSLAALASTFLDLYFADIANELVAATGVRGGASTRAYKDNSSFRGGTDPSTWLMGLFDSASTLIGHFPSLAAATSDYVPPSIVHAIARDGSDHLYVSRRFGKGLNTHMSVPTDDARYSLEFPASTLRRTWRTRDYVLGAISLDPALGYVAVNEQNRNASVMFAAGRDERIVVQGDGPEGDSVGMREINAVAGKDCLLVARDPRSDAVTNRIFVSKTAWQNLSRPDLVAANAGWFFTRVGEAFAAFRIASGGYRLPTEPLTASQLVAAQSGGQLLNLVTRTAPVVVQLGQASRYAGASSDEKFEAFKRDVKSPDRQLVAYGNFGVGYTCISGERYEIYSDRTVPKLNGRTLELNPPKLYQSPYIDADWDASVVRLKFPGMPDVPLTF
jgi:hypothetical protein